EELERDAVRLLQNLAPVLGVGVVAQIRAFVDEALTVHVHDQPQRVGVLLVEVADAAIAGWRRVQVPRHRVRAGPVAVRLRPDVERHLDAVARVVACAAYLRELPAGAQVPRAHLGGRLEAAGGEYDGAALELVEALGIADAQAVHAAAVVDEQRAGLRAVAHLDAVPVDGVEELVREPAPAADGLGDQPAPEAKLSVDL